MLYGWGEWSPVVTAPATQRDFHALVRGWGLPALDKFSTARTADEVWAAVRAFDQTRAKLAFPVDGAVV